jgi:hypothetical protein
LRSRAERVKLRKARTVNKTEKEQIVTVYANAQATSITDADQLSYPYPSIIVMETPSVSHVTR